METSQGAALGALLDTLWRDYQAITPDAGRIHALLEARGEIIVNDHIALRTFGVPEVDIDVMARAFVAAGYQAGGDYEFPAKRLRARHYEPPAPGLPKVFISQLEVERFSPTLQRVVRTCVAALPEGATERPDFAAAGRLWPLERATYHALLAESEYAAWVAAFGFRANHFTVDVRALRSFPGLAELNRFLEENGFALNRSGGAIKGTPEDLLQQSSTLANAVEVELTDGVLAIPSCYYEFAYRHARPDGTLFSGFVPESADRLFESTDSKR